MEVSADVSKPYTLSWLSKMLRGSAIIGAILSIIHPELYSAGIETMKMLAASPENVHKGEQLGQVLQVWSAPFNVISTINNRETPLHRDNGSGHAWFDMLIPLGHYKNGRLDLPGLGLTLRYDPRTIVAFTGRLLRHGASCPGDRACMAYYMRHQVVKQVTGLNPDWMDMALYAI
jgi:hypothetical protein